MGVKRIQINDILLTNQSFGRTGKIYALPNESPVADRLVEFFERYNIQDYTGHSKVCSYNFMSKQSIAQITVLGFDNRDLNELQDDDWVVIRGVHHTVGVFRTPSFEVKRELERRLFIELVSVPPGRFGRLLPDGGVEYQRQLTRFDDLRVGLN